MFQIVQDFCVGETAGRVCACRRQDGREVRPGVLPLYCSVNGRSGVGIVVVIEGMRLNVSAYAPRCGYEVRGILECVGGSS